MEAVAAQSDVRDEAEHWLEDVGLASQKDTTAASLSRGDKRRLELAMGLVQKPRLLLLDEPTAGMSRADTNATIDLLKKIKARGMTKVIIEHDMHVVFSLADRITVLAQGAIIADGAPGRGHAATRACRKPISGGAHAMSVDARSETAPRPPTPPGLLQRARHPRLLRRELHRAGRQLRRRRGRDPGAARPQRRRQDLDAPHPGARPRPRAEAGRDLAARPADPPAARLPGGAQGHPAGAGGPAHHPRPDRRGEPDARPDRRRRGLVARPDLRALPPPRPNGASRRA